MSLNPEIMSDALKFLRLISNLKQNELAMKLNISTSILSEMESCKRPVNLGVLERYSAVLDIHLSSIIFFIENFATGIEASLTSDHHFINPRILTLLHYRYLHNVYHANINNGNLAQRKPSITIGGVIPNKPESNVWNC